MSTIGSKFQSSVRELNEESEEVLGGFLDGSIDFLTFFPQYGRLRQRYHTCALNWEKFKQARQI